MFESPAKRKARLEAEAYARAVKADAVARQERARLERHGCCWEPLTGSHHPVCANAEDPKTPPPLIDGQETLA